MTCVLRKDLRDEWTKCLEQAERRRRIDACVHVFGIDPRTQTPGCRSRRLGIDRRSRRAARGRDGRGAEATRAEIEEQKDQHQMWIMSDRAVFVNFHGSPLAGTHSLDWDEAVKISGADPPLA